MTLTPEDLERVWSAIEAHIESERKTARLISDARKSLAGTRNVVQQYLLAYLEHDDLKIRSRMAELLGSLGNLQAGRFPIIPHPHRLEACATRRTLQSRDDG